MIEQQKIHKEKIWEIREKFQQRMKLQKIIQRQKTEQLQVIQTQIEAQTKEN